MDADVVDKTILSLKKGVIITVFYNDTAQSVTFKTGAFETINASFIKLLDDSKKYVFIPTKNIVRIEHGGYYGRV